MAFERGQRNICLVLPYQLRYKLNICLSSDSLEDFSAPFHTLFSLSEFY